MVCFDSLCNLVLEERNTTGNVKGLDVFIDTLQTAFNDVPEDIIDKIKTFIIKSQCPEIVFEPLKGALGIALIDKCAINTTVLSFKFAKALYVIFHEIAHQYQYSKHGENFVEKIYFDEINLEKAGKFLHNVEITADRYAIRTVKHILGDRYNTQNLQPFYKRLTVQGMTQHLEVVRNMVRSMGLKNINEINQFIYNQIKNSVLK